MWLLDVFCHLLSISLLLFIIFFLFFEFRSLFLSPSLSKSIFYGLAHFSGCWKLLLLLLKPFAFNCHLPLCALLCAVLYYIWARNAIYAVRTSHKHIFVRFCWFLCVMWLFFFFLFGVRFYVSFLSISTSIQKQKSKKITHWNLRFYANINNSFVFFLFHILFLLFMITLQITADHNIHFFSSFCVPFLLFFPLFPNFFPYSYIS